MENNSLLKLIKELSAKSRVSGYRGEMENFVLIKNKISNNFPGKAHFQNYKILTWKELKAPELVVDEKNVECVSVYYNPAGSFSGRLEFFDSDQSEEDNEFKIYSIRNRKDIKAFILVSKNFERPFYYSQGLVSYLLPSVIVGSKHLEFLKSKIGKKVSLKIKSKFLIKNSRNLVHKISDRKKKFKLIAAAHVDTVPHSRGVIDDAAGIAILLKLAEKLKKTNLPFDVWMIYFGAEENSMYGSKYFIETLKSEELSRIKYMISVDGVGLGHKITAYSESDYHPQIEKAFESIKPDLILKNIDDSLDSSDQYYFKLAGVDSCLLSGIAENHYYHSKEADELKNINTKLCEETVQGLFNFISNMEFKSPDISFSKKSRKINFLKNLAFLYRNL